MMKWVLRIFYTIAVLLIGFIVISSAQVDRSRMFYEKEAIPNLLEGNFEEFIEDTMVVSNINSYITKPILKYKSTDENYKFNINVYHFQVLNGKNLEHGLIFYLSDIEINGLENILNDYDSYLENKSLMGINIRINSGFSNHYYEQNLGITFNDIDLKSTALEPIYIKQDETESFFEVTGYDNNGKTFSKIQSIEFRIVDATDKENDYVVNNKVFAKLVNNDDLKVINSDLVNELNEVEGILTSNEFIGDPSIYLSLEDHYQDESDIYPTKIIDKSVLNNYNHIITKAIVLYSLSIVVTTFLLFFLKPVIKKIKENKASKEVKPEET